MNKVMLSIIIPVYNGEKYIKSLIEMILRQCFSSFEVIIVDDGSTDETYEISKSYAAQYSWLRVIHTKNHGVSHARNIGIEEASGEWIQFLDADDKVEKNMFHDFYKILLEEKTDLAACGCIRRNLVSGMCESCGPKENSALRNEEFKKLFDNMKMEDRYWLLDYIWNKWYRRAIIEKNQIRFEERISLGEDFLFNAQYMQCIHSIALLSGTYYQYYVGENGLVSKFQPEPWIGRQFLYEAQEQLYQSLDLWDSNKLQIQSQAGQIYFGDIRAINRKNCHYHYKEKLRFLKNAMNSKQFSFVLTYLNGKKTKFRVYHRVFARKNEHLILSLITLEKIVKYILP